MRLLVTGDYSPRDRVSKAIQIGKAASVFASIKDIVSSSDYAIVNFECAVAGLDAKPITKFGSNLKCSKEAVKLLKETGFNCVTLANNHFRDFGDVGVERTLEALDEFGLDSVGGGKNISEASKILYKDIRGERLAIINICENEFSIADEQRGGSAPLDVVDVSRRIKEARKVSDFVVVIIHGGHEHFQYPSPRMKKLYRYFVEEGADTVINHHQHCYSGFEEYKGRPIFYGIGNFCFDLKGSRGSIWNEGYMVALDMSEGRVSYELYPYTQCDDQPSVDLMTEPKLQAFWLKVDSISNIIKDDWLLQQKYEEFLKDKLYSVLTPFTPYQFDYARVAAGRHYLPLLINKTKMAQMLDFVACESHRDILTRAMQDYIE